MEVGGLSFSLFVVDFGFCLFLVFAFFFTGEEALGELVCETLVFALGVVELLETVLVRLDDNLTRVLNVLVALQQEVNID